MLEKKTVIKIEAADLVRCPNTKVEGNWYDKKRRNNKQVYKTLHLKLKTE